MTTLREAYLRIEEELNRHNNLNARGLCLVRDDVDVRVVWSYMPRAGRWAIFLCTPHDIYSVNQMSPNDLIWFASYLPAFVSLVVPNNGSAEESARKALGMASVEARG